MLQKYLPVFVQAIHHDEVKVKTIALQAMFDFLCEFGVKTIYSTQNKKSSQDSTRRTMAESTTTDTSQEEDEDEQMDFESFTEHLSQLLLEQLKDETPQELQKIALEGIYKMFILGKKDNTDTGMANVVNVIMNRSVGPLEPTASSVSA